MTQRLLVALPQYNWWNFGLEVFFYLHLLSIVYILCSSSLFPCGAETLSDTATCSTQAVLHCSDFIFRSFNG